jgi:DNA-3-methyladenine glycosylase II
MTPFSDLLTSAHNHLVTRDPVLRPLIKHVGPCSLLPDPNGFAVLVRSVVSQLISTTAARTISGRLAAALGPQGVTPEAVLGVSEETMRGVGLSRTKVQAIRALATRVQNGELPLAQFGDLTDDEIAAHLTDVRGIGPWTAHMFLIFGLGRPDILPASDLGVRAGVQQAYGLAEMPTPAEVRLRGEVWRPFRSIATWYMWRSRGFVPQSQV